MFAFFKELFDQFESEKSKMKKDNIEISDEMIPNFYLIQSLYLCFVYLKSLLVADSMFLYGTFSLFDLESIKVRYSILI